MKRPKLATVFAFRLAVTLAVAMTFYAMLTGSRDTVTPVWQVAVVHGAHVVGLGVLLYCVLLWGFDRLVGAPLRTIQAHLYKVATGRLEPIEVPARVREIEDIVRYVNLMVCRMQFGGGDADPHRAALALRDVAARLRARGPVAAAAILEAAATLDAVVAQGSEGSV